MGVINETMERLGILGEKAGLLSAVSIGQAGMGGMWWGLDTTGAGAGPQCQAVGQVR